MKIARFEHGGLVLIGSVEGEVVRPLPGSDVLSLLAASPAERAQKAERAGAPVALADVSLMAPLAPRSMRDFMVFEEHFEGALKNFHPDGTIPAAWYEAPRFYFTNSEAVVGPFDDVPIPPGCEVFDFEFEVAAVIGRAGASLGAAEARDHIAGYVVFNDWSARDLQSLEMPVGLGPAKGKDSATTLGPWIVTADELEPHRRGDRLHLDMTVELNGEEFGRDTLANMAWSFEELVAYASRGTRVVPGDVLASGTCAAGCLAEIWGRRGRRDPRPLAAGDVVTMTVEGIGTISNRVVASLPVPDPVPAARPPGFRLQRDH